MSISAPIALLGPSPPAPSHSSPPLLSLPDPSPLAPSAFASLSTRTPVFFSVSPGSNPADADSRCILRQLAMTAHEALGRCNEWLQSGSPGIGFVLSSGSRERIVRMWDFELYSLRRFVLSLLPPAGAGDVDSHALERVWRTHDFLRSFPNAYMFGKVDEWTEKDVAERFLGVLREGERLDAGQIPNSTLQSFLAHLTSHPPFYTLVLRKRVTLDMGTFESEEERTWGGAVLRARGVGGVVWRGGGVMVDEGA